MKQANVTVYVGSFNPLAEGAFQLQYWIEILSHSAWRSSCGHGVFFLCWSQWSFSVGTSLWESPYSWASVVWLCLGMSLNPLCLGAAVPAEGLDFYMIILQEKCHGNSKVELLGRIWVCKPHRVFWKFYPLAFAHGTSKPIFSLVLILVCVCAWRWGSCQLLNYWNKGKFSKAFYITLVPFLLMNDSLMSLFEIIITKAQF